MGSGLRDGFGPHAALGSPFRRHLGGGPCCGPGSFRVPHYLTQDHRAWGHSTLRKPTSTAIRAISNFGTGKSRTCARRGCLRIERWARGGVCPRERRFPTRLQRHRRDGERRLYVDSGRPHRVNCGRCPAAWRTGQIRDSGTGVDRTWAPPAAPPSSRRPCRQCLLSPSTSQAPSLFSLGRHAEFRTLLVEKGRKTGEFRTPKFEFRLQK